MFKVISVRCGTDGIGGLSRVLPNEVVEVEATDGVERVYATSMHTHEAGGIERVLVGARSIYDECIRREEDSDGAYADVEYCEGEKTGDDAGGKYDDLIKIARDFMTRFVEVSA